MTNKQQTEQLKEALNKYARAYGKSFETVYGEYTVARTLIDFGMLPLLLPENVVVLTKSKYDTTIDFIKHLQHKIDELHESNRNKYKQTRKETAKEIIANLKRCMQAYEDDDDGYLLKKCEFKSFMLELAKQYGTEVPND